MLKKILLIITVLAMMLTFAGCGEKIALHCDSCGEEVMADADSNMDESWLIYCEKCEKELLSDGFIPET